MTPKENLLHTLSGGTPDWMPCCVHIANENNLPGFLPSAMQQKPLDFMSISDFTGGDLLCEVQGMSMHVSEKFKMENVREGNASRSVLATPDGSLSQEIIYTNADTPTYRDVPRDYAVPGPIPPC